MHNYEKEIPIEETREEKVEKYYQEIESMADGVGAMRKFLIENPQSDEKLFQEKVLDNEENNLSNSVKEKLGAAFLDYQVKVKVVENNQKLYKDNPKEFFEEMFGSRPRGKVNIVWHPLGAQFFLARSDYEKVIGKTIESFTVKPLQGEGGFYDESLGSGNMSGLTSVCHKKIPEDAAEKIFQHEIQHVIHHNFFASNKEILKKFHRDLKRQTVESLLKDRSYLETFRNILGERWRDEVLAYYISDGKISSAQECVGIDSERMISEIQEQIFEEYLREVDPKFAHLINDLEFRSVLLKAVREKKLDDFIEILIDSAEKHKVRTPTDDEAIELHNEILKWKDEYLGPLITSLIEANTNFYKEIKDKKEPLVKNLISHFGGEKAFNLLSTTHFSKLHHLEKLIERK